MGTEFCPECYEGGEYVGEIPLQGWKYAPSASKGVVLIDSVAEQVWRFSMLLLHMVSAHRMKPPDAFITAVMRDRLDPLVLMTEDGRPDESVPITIKMEELEAGQVPIGFLFKLDSLCR